MDKTGPGANVKSLFSYGFRPFFLLASLTAVIFLGSWLKVFFHGGDPSPHFHPVNWHAHEMLFGFTTAVIAGFLLTAVPNWTGEEARRGTPLIALSLLWISARIAIVTTQGLISATLDLAFLPALVALVAGPLARKKNPKVLVFVPILVCLWVGNLLMHLEALGIKDTARLGISISLSFILLMIVVIGGRVIPFFTLRALGTNPQKSPTADALAVLSVILLPFTEYVSNIAILIWAAVSIVAHLWRMKGWFDRRVLSVPLLWVLYLGYLWIPIGMAATAASRYSLVLPSAATHAYTVGAIGVVVLGMIARVSLGHTGRPLVASGLVTFSFVCIQVAAMLRVFGPHLSYNPAHYLGPSGLLWCLSYLIFFWVYTPILVQPRPDGKS